MAVLQTIRNFFVSQEIEEPEIVVPAPAETTYEIHTLTEKHLKEVMRVNLRCFKKGENYTKHTFSFLLNEPTTLSYRVATPKESIVGFIFVMTNQGTGHITTIGVLPEHRRRRLAQKMIQHAEEALRRREIATVSLEVRVSNIAAQSLYRGLGYAIVQRLNNYYNNGEDAFLMVKSLH
jgi:ribosomal-protein-alanine N-acetyltransferase